MKRMLLFVIVALIFAAVSARVVRHKRHAGDTEEVKHESTAESVIDTIAAPPSDLVVIYGYDKPLRATREVVFVKNNHSEDVRGLSLRLTYFDTSGRLLHKRTHSLKIEVPAGETRRAEIPTWDTNYSFYFKGSRPPRVSATPYTVKCSVDTVFSIGRLETETE